MDQVCGGYTETRDAAAEIQEICNKVKRDVEENTKKVYKEFSAVKYRSQVVAGANYLIKVDVGDGHFLDIKVFQQLPCYGGKLRLEWVKEGQTKDSPLEP